MQWKLSSYYVYCFERGLSGEIIGLKCRKVNKLQYKIYNEDGSFRKILEVELTGTKRKVTDITNNIEYKDSCTSLIKKEKGIAGTVCKMVALSDKSQYDVSTVSNSELSTYLRSFSKYENFRIKNMGKILDYTISTIGKKEVYTNDDIKEIMSEDEVYASRLGADLGLLELNKQQSKLGVANLYLLDIRRDKVILSVDFLVVNEGKAVDIVKNNKEEFVKLMNMYWDKYGCQNITFDRLMVNHCKIITGMTIDFICYPRTREDAMRIVPKVVRPTVYETTV